MIRNKAEYQEVKNAILNKKTHPFKSEDGQVSQPEQEISLAEVDISHSWISVTDMVFNSGDTKTFACDISVSASCFSVGFRFCGLGCVPGCSNNGI